MSIVKLGTKREGKNTLARIATALPLPTPSDAPLPFTILKQSIKIKTLWNKYRVIDHF